jgi:hypothetical protein
MDDAKKNEARRRLFESGIEADQTWRHYKGRLYTVVAAAIKEDTLEPMVVYRSKAEGTIWVRTLENWREPVGSSGSRVPRFIRMLA